MYVRAKDFTNEFVVLLIIRIVLVAFVCEASKVANGFNGSPIVSLCEIDYKMYFLTFRMISSLDLIRHHETHCLLEKLNNIDRII